jgi:hypothetical protein
MELIFSRRLLLAAVSCIYSTSSISPHLHIKGKGEFSAKRKDYISSLQPYESWTSFSPGSQILRSKISKMRTNDVTLYVNKNKTKSVGAN